MGRFIFHVVLNWTKRSFSRHQVTDDDDVVTSPRMDGWRDGWMYMHAYAHTHAYAYAHACICMHIHPSMHPPMHPYTAM